MTAPTDAGSLTPHDVYDRMLGSLEEGGDIAHVTVRFDRSATGAVDVPDTQMEVWLDLKREQARVKTSVSGGAGDTEEVVTNAASYDAGHRRPVEPLTCHGSDSPLLSLLLNCAGYLEESQTIVEGTQDLNGRQSIVLLTTGTTSGEDETDSLTIRLFVDTETWLPLEAQSEQTRISGEPKYSARTIVRYQTDVLDSASLPDNFFDPAAIGYVEPNPAANLAPSVDGKRVYWLGRRFSPGGGLPDLDLSTAGTFPAGAIVPGYHATLAYADAASVTAPPTIGLQEYTADYWDAVFVANSLGGNWWEQPGTVREDIQTDDRRVVLFHRPDGGYERFMGWVYVGSTLVLVDDFSSASPYASREGFLAVARGLIPYE